MLDNFAGEILMFLTTKSTQTADIFLAKFFENRRYRVKVEITSGQYYKKEINPNKEYPTLTQTIENDDIIVYGTYTSMKNGTSTTNKFSAKVYAIEPFIDAINFRSTLSAVSGLFTGKNGGKRKLQTRRKRRSHKKKRSGKYRK